MPAVNIFWFRRDLRLDDNAGLYHALKEGIPVLPIFIFDRNILDDLSTKSDSRVHFIHNAVYSLQEHLQKLGSAMEVRYGFPVEIFSDLVNEYSVNAVFTNHDYEPYARERDKQVEQLLNSRGITFKTFKDQVILEKSEVIKDDGKPYTVFTPYSKKWKSVSTDFHLKSYNTRKYFNQFLKQYPKEIISLEAMGFKKTGAIFPKNEWLGQLIRNYKETRDFPAIEGTSRLGVHLRFGTTSIRQLAFEAGGLNDVFLNELIWREFYQMILWHFPHVVGHSFKPAYDNIQWINNEKQFDAWCHGKTGYPIVDAGMRELNETGYMHNRVRMITASFLVKHLLVDWRWGEAYFAEKLLDYELASNNGGWQWAAGSGTDAAPYFRIFNPTLQAKKFDPEGKYIHKWITEIDSFDYPAPIVDHESARKRCLEVYSKALKK